MFHIINHLYDGSFSYLYNSLKCNLNLYIQFTLYYITYPKPILQPVMIPSQFPSRFALCCVGYTPSVTLFPLCFAGHAFHSAFYNVFRNAFHYVSITVSIKLRVCAPLGEGERGPHLTQSRLRRGLAPYQVAFWCMQPFGHNRNGPKIGEGLRPLLGRGSGVPI